MAVQQSTFSVPRAALGAAFQEYARDPSRFIGSRVLPLLPTQVQAAKFLKLTRESMANLPNARRNKSGSVNRIDIYTEDDSYTCEEWVLEGRLADAQRIFYQSDFDAEVATVDAVEEQLMLLAENRVASAVFDTATWTGATLYTDNSGNPWSTAGTNIIKQVVDAAEKVRLSSGGLQPNTLIIGAAQVPNLLNNTGIRAAFPGAPIVTIDMIMNSIGSLFGISQVLIGRAQYNSADEGQTFTGTDIWSSSYAMIAAIAPEGAPILTPCIGRTFLWESDTPNMLTAKSYREEQTDSDIYNVSHWLDEKIFDANFGHLIKIA